MKLLKSYTKGGNVKIVDEKGFSICNMTSNVAKDNEANADYIIALNEQRNELLDALTSIDQLAFHLMERLSITAHEYKQITDIIKNANQK